MQSDECKCSTCCQHVVLVPDADVEAGDDKEPEQTGQRGRIAEAHVVTEEDAAAARFSIDQVVLPLPGCRIHYPRHDTAQVDCHSLMPPATCHALNKVFYPQNWMQLSVQVLCMDTTLMF